MDRQLMNFNSMVSDYTVINPEFARVKVYVCYAGKNRNRSEISREVLDKISQSVYGVPVVAEYNKDTNTFKGHGGKLEITDEGMDWVQTTVPYGFVDPQTPVFYEEVTELDGITKNEYLCCYAYLWYKRYPEVESVLRNQDNSPIGQSMEIEVSDYSWSEDDYCVIKDGHFSALCMLGVEPCFESAKVTSRFSKEDIENEYQEMIESFKKYTLSNFEEGGEEVQEEEKKIEIEEETTEPKVEEPVVEDVKTEEEPSSEEFENKDDEKEPISSNFELSFDEIRDKLNEMIRYQVKNLDVYRYVCTVYNDHFIYEEETYGEEYTQKHYRQGYSKTESEVVLEGERVEVFAQFLTKEEIDKLEADKAEFEKKHADEINELKSNFVDLQGELETAKDNYSKLEEEVVGLREFKANIEFEEHKAMVDERLDKYSELETIDGYSELVKDKYTCDLDALEKEIKVFAFDNGVILGKKQKKNFSKEVSGRIPVAQKNVETRKESAWDILDKYVPKKIN